MYKKETAREFQRRRAVELMEQGESPSIISRILDVSIGSIHRWQKIYHEGGSLKFTPVGGRPRRLSDAQLETLRGLLLRGATAFGVQRTIYGPATILWDAIPIHCSKPVNQYLENHNQLIVEQFPSYAPELKRSPMGRGQSFIQMVRL